MHPLETAMQVIEEVIGRVEEIGADNVPCVLVSVYERCKKAHSELKECFIFHQARQPAVAAALDIAETASAVDINLEVDADARISCDDPEEGTYVECWVWVDGESLKEHGYNG